MKIKTVKQQPKTKLVEPPKLQPIPKFNDVLDDIMKKNPKISRTRASMMANKTISDVIRANNSLVKNYQKLIKAEWKYAPTNNKSRDLHNTIRYGITNLSAQTGAQGFLVNGGMSTVNNLTGAVNPSNNHNTDNNQDDIRDGKNDNNPPGTL